MKTKTAIILITTTRYVEKLYGFSCKVKARKSAQALAVKRNSRRFFSLFRAHWNPYHLSTQPFTSPFTDRLINYSESKFPRRAHAHISRARLQTPKCAHTCTSPRMQNLHSTFPESASCAIRPINIINRVAAMLERERERARAEDSNLASLETRETRVFACARGIYTEHNFASKSFNPAWA